MMRKSLWLPLMLCALLPLLASCVHEWGDYEEPEPPTPPAEARHLKLTLNFEKEMPHWQTIEYGENFEKPKRARRETLMRRYIIRAYTEEDIHTRTTRSEEQEWVFIRPAGENPDTVIDIEFPKIDGLRLLVWSDYIYGSGDELHYMADDFNEISLKSQDSYQGHTDTREGFRGDYTVGLKETAVVVEMNRPMAKLQFITNDLDQFLAEKGQQLAPEGAPDINVSDYGIRVLYPRFMPFSFNMFTNRPADSWTGTNFMTVMRPLSGTTAEMMYDYMFVNTHDTALTVQVQVFDRRSGELLAQIPMIDVPLRRGHVTVVTGPFLTTHAKSGAGINPEFDGEFNIEFTR